MLMVLLMLKLKKMLKMRPLFMVELHHILNGVFNDDPLGLILLRFKENGPSVDVVDVVDVNDDANCSLGSRSISFEADINDVDVVVGRAANGLNGFGSVTVSDSVSDPSSILKCSK